eukprot:TRINITY_DN19248_c0_g1_i1.p1 TRINITY_DN19248_c0_g1~~TRINITY_DN19248_c0_g1_i1.p1  ORF type:complete len:256 (-),score=65.02 TRINITY_DN19248_c0_g1_i1:47-814(-)
MNIPAPTFAEWRASLQGRARGFAGCVTVGCGAKTLEAVAALLEHEGVYGAFGIHPLNAADWSPAVVAKLRRLARLPKAVAWGECGLDYYDKRTGGEVRSEELRELQRQVFARQLRLAVELDKPLVLHTRAAERDTLELLLKDLPSAHPVHAHCFTSSKEMAWQLLDKFPNLYLGFTGVVTFKDADAIREVVDYVPLERILLETDGPYMAPIPHRRRIAHPGHIVDVADGIAKIKKLSAEEVLTVCRQNARQMYGI